MIKLNFPKYSFRTKSDGQRTQIFDIVRQKYVVLTDEEWVRQHGIHYLNKEKQYPISLMKVGRQINLNGQQKRFDLVCYDINAKPILLVEFKRPKVSIDQGTFNQIARYNIVMKTPYLWMSNGMTHFAAQVDFNIEKVSFIKEIPNYTEL